MTVIQNLRRNNCSIKCRNLREYKKNYYDNLFSYFNQYIYAESLYKT